MPGATQTFPCLPGTQVAARGRGGGSEAPEFCQTPRIRWMHPLVRGDLPPLTPENWLPDPGELAFPIPEKLSRSG